MNTICTPHLLACFQDKTRDGSNLSITNALKEATTLLNHVSESARLDAELLLAHCLEKTRTYLHTWPEKNLSPKQLSQFIDVLEKRLDDYPVAYLTGKKAFWTFELCVTPAVLIPRPETELIVETALEVIKGIKNPKILDLGTGSGAIALALATERTDANVYASDYSTEALAIAQQNADRLALSSVHFIHSDWFSNITDQAFDLIVANPPYIDPQDPHLLSTIRHEPQEALVADNKGMRDIETIIQQSTTHLKKQAYLMIEHGYDQSEKTLAVFKKHGFNNRRSQRDLNHNWRISLARYDHSLRKI